MNFVLFFNGFKNIRLLLEIILSFKKCFACKTSFLNRNAFNIFLSRCFKWRQGLVTHSEWSKSAQSSNILVFRRLANFRHKTQQIYRHEINTERIMTEICLPREPCGMNDDFCQSLSTNLGNPRNRSRERTAKNHRVFFTKFSTVHASREIASAISPDISFAPASVNYHTVWYITLYRTLYMFIFPGLSPRSITSAAY